MYACRAGEELYYDLTAPKFQTAFRFLHRNDLKDLSEGWIELDNGVRVSVQNYVTSSAKELSFESHEKYFDIQYIAEGDELIGCCTRRGLTVSVPYSEENDITFYKDPELSGYVYLHTGELVVLSPDDVHKPRCAAGAPMAVKKIVIKVPV